MTLTRARTVQYIGILFALALIAVGYWYFGVRAGVKTNTSALQSQGVGDLSAALGAYWKFDENTGLSAADASTNGNNGTLTNGPTWTTGQIGSAVTLDGTNDYVATTTVNGSIDNLTELTYSAWIYPTSGTGSILGKGTNGGGREGFIITGSTLQGWVANGTGEYAGRATSTTTVALSSWQHVVMTYSDSGDRKPRLYLNGTEVAYSEQDTLTNGLDPDPDFDFTIGIIPSGTYFTGSMDEVRIYQRALSADEVSNLYRLTAPTGVDTGLKGYWSFNSDALSGTTAYDWSGAGKSGTLTNGPAIAEGRVGQGLSFDGSNDYIATTATIPSQGTISIWAKPNFPLDPSTRSYFQYSSEAGGHFYFGFNTYGGYDTWEFSYRGGYGSTVDILGKPYTSDVDVQQWHHVVVSWDTATGGQMYVDGTLVSSTTGTTGNFTAMPMSIGADSGDFWKGGLDEVRLYNRMLTAAEIKSQYDRGVPDKANTSALQPGGNGRLDSGLAGYWKLDETTGSSAADASTNANAGTLSNMENGDWVTGQIGNSLDFDGTNEYVAASATPFTSHSSGTITAWIKSTNGSAAQTIFGISTLASSNYGGYFHTNANGKLQMRIKGNGVDLVNCGVTDTGSSAQVAASGTWTFVAITNDGAGKKFYKNAFQQGTDCGSDTTWFDDLSAQTPVDASVGAWLVAGGAQTLFLGSIDEVRVYDHALSPDEIGNLYRTTTPTAVDTGLKGYWSFNGQDMSGTSAYDRSGAGNTGTLTSGPVIREGIVGQALSFDGSDDYVTVPTSSALNPTAQITVSAWVKRVGTGVRQFMISKGNATTEASTQYWLEFTAGNNIVFELDSGSTQHTLTSSFTLADTSNWHHIAGTYDGTTQKLYVDGIQDSSTLTWSGAINTTSHDLALGNRSSFYNIPFSGLLDEPRIYNRALTTAEIKAQFDAGAPDKTNSSISTPQGTGRLDSGLAGYWKFDDGSGSTVTDASANGNNGTQTGGMTWTTGQVGGAGSFDGSDDTVTVSAGTGVIDAKQNVTLSVWLYPRVVGSYRGFIYKGVVGCDEGTAKYMLEIDVSSFLRFWMGGSSLSTSASGATLLTNQWQHLVATNSAAGSAIYLNGVRVASGSAMAAPSSSSEDWKFNYCNRFDGNMDEIRIYDRALSSDEVSQLYRLNSPTGTETSLKGYWSFNGQDMSGTTAYDRSGAGYNGTLTNSPTITEGKLGQGLNFTASTNVVVLPSTAATGFGTGDFSFSAWVKTSGFVNQGSSVNTVIARGYLGQASGYGIGYNSANTPVCQVSSDGVTTGGAPLNDGKWHFLMVVRRSNVVECWQNGVKLTDGATASNIGSTVSMHLGNDDSAPYARSIVGNLDEVRLYSRALSTDEIKALYASGK